ncbi:MAG TPA: hypothetical protein VGL70_22410 [Candidatus Binatia bacterium]|jgi:glycosyltransferase involved in cell wall biosynthesis
MAKIVSVYNAWRRSFEPADMSYIRWLKISEALARRGHSVDLATNEPRWWLRRAPVAMAQNLKRVPIAKVRWKDYDVVKTLFHVGFDTLETYGGDRHPFIISKLGSIVAPQDAEGIYFYGRVRKRLYATQEKIHRRSRYVTVLSQPAKDLWRECFHSSDNILLVPGGVDRDIPSAGADPYPARQGTRCLFAGHVYTKRSQPEANRVLTTKLNRLGELFSRRGGRLYMLGSGDVSGLDGKHVTYLGVASYDRAWEYFHHADVGLVVAAGEFNHNNESSKIYHYLRAGLPVVSEAGFPNDNVVVESKLGFVVANGALEAMAAKAAEAADKAWDREYAVSYILNHHTWDRRVEVYHELLRQHFG